MVVLQVASLIALFNFKLQQNPNRYSLRHSMKITITLRILLSTIIIFFSTTLSAHGLPPNTTSLTPMLKKVMPSIVNIMVERSANPQNNLALKDKPENEITIGSGVIINAKKGLIITNAHVISNAKTIIVTLNNGERYHAKLSRADEDFDIGIIQIKANNLKEIALANSDNLEVGNFVAAIGSPFGLEESTTSGIISALNRTHPHIENYQNFIQTDTPINPGNSGGALVNMQGQLVGINTAIVGPHGNIGIGFAIPSNMAMAASKQLLQYGEIKHGMLGILVQNLTPSLTKAMKSQQSKGALVSDVIPQSPAEKAGVKPGDIITAIDKTPIHDANQIKNIVALTHPKTTITITSIRNNTPQELKATIISPDELLMANTNPYLTGVSLQPFNELETDGSSLSGILVSDIKPTAQASLNGLIPGDVITTANEAPVSTIKELQTIANNTKDSLLLKINRNNRSLFIAITHS